MKLATILALLRLSVACETPIKIVDTPHEEPCPDNWLPGDIPMCYGPVDMTEAQLKNEATKNDMI